MRRLLHLLLLYATLINTAMSCPTHCNCKWKGGKQTVDCVNKSMIMVPHGIDSSTQVLDFTGNNLKTLGSDQFQRLGLVNLQKIFLSHCHLTALDDCSFKGLTNLVDLDLSNNILYNVPVEVFSDLPSLMKLNLNGNPFKVIKSYTFKKLKFLVSLELSRCELKVIESHAFYGLGALEMLKLDYNFLKFIAGVNTIPLQLHGIHLQYNPWFCDCKLADLHKWLNLTNLPQAVQPTCEGPMRLQGALIKQLEERELACLPDISPTSLFLEIPEGKNVSLLCRVNAVPKARVLWKFQDQVLQNNSMIPPSVHLYYFIEERTIEKRSELFIFNTTAEDNGTFVCIAENQAGQAQSNYTLRIMPKDELIQTSRKIITNEYMMGLCIAVAAVIVFLLTYLISSWLQYRVKQRCHREKEKNMVLANEGNLKGSSVIRRGAMLSTIGDVSIHHKANGSIYIGDQSTLKMSLVTRGDEQAATSVIGTTATVNASVSHILYPCHTFTSEPNPDLISDTAQDKKFVISDIEGNGIGINYGVHRQLLQEDPTYSSISLQLEDKGWTTTITTITNTTLTSTNATTGISIPSKDGVHSVPISMCFNHFLSKDLHKVPQKLMTNGYPSNFSVPKLATHFPAVLPATAFYRTLPYKRHNTASYNLSSARYVRDAELITRSMQPASFEHFGTCNIRYNMEGYPKNSPSPSYIDTLPHGSFSDTVQILENPSKAMVEWCKGTQKENQASMSGVPIMHMSLQTSQVLHGNGQHIEKVDNNLVVNNSMDSSANTKLMTIQIPVKNISDSPDEGYVGGCVDITDV